MSTVVRQTRSKVSDRLALPAAVVSCVAVGATVSFGPFVSTLFHHVFGSM